MAKNKLNLDNITPELADAVRSLEHWYGCNAVRSLPATASLAEIRAACEVDANKIESIAGDITRACQTLRSQLGR